MDNGSWIDTRGSRSSLMDQIMDDYILSYDRFGIEIPGPKMTQLKQIKSFFEGVSIHDLAVEDVLNFAAERRKTVVASTLQTQIYYLKQAVQNSRIKTEEDVVEIGINELRKKKIIGRSAWRDRRLNLGEWDALMWEGGDHWITCAMEIAVTSAMRQGEIHALNWKNIDFDRGVITAWRKDNKAETGQSKQKIPMIQGVREALLRFSNQVGSSGNLFHVKRASSISDKFARMTDKLGIEDLRFHDLRHEAISRMFERGMRVEQVRVVSGHRTLDQLSRYINLRAEDLAGL